MSEQALALGDVDRFGDISQIAPAMKDCPIPTCRTRIARELVMCHEHWPLVPRELRERIRSTYAGGREAGSAAHIGACLAAVADVNQRLDALQEVA